MQAESLAKRWAAAWSQRDPEQWVSLFTPSAKYTVHAFLFFRTGTNGLRDHFQLWRNSLPDFVMEVRDVWPAEWLPAAADDTSASGDGGGRGRYRVSVRTYNAGTFERDLRVWKATGKKMWFWGVVDFVVQAESGLIESVDEWYSLRWIVGEGESEYVDRDRG